VDVSSGQALAWRLERHFLREGAGSVRDVVGRLSAIPAWSGDADLAVRRRLNSPALDAVGEAMRSGELIKTYAFRGATHLLAAEHAGVFMAVRGSSAQWTLPSWQQHYDLRPHDWDGLRDAARAAVADGPISHGELVDAITKHSRFRHLRQGLSNPSHTLLKPLAWQGDICFGPTSDGSPTFQSPSSSPFWQGLPDVDDAGRRAVLLYLSGYGPASYDNLHYWLVAGLSAGRRRLDSWLAALVEEVVEVRVNDRPMFHLREHLETLANVVVVPEETTLLPAYDQWVLGPGTADEGVVPQEHRQVVTRGAGLLLHAGRVAGTWKLNRNQLHFSWLPQQAPLQRELIAHEANRLSELLRLRTASTVTDLH
jgi:hypothetical protein